MRASKQIIICILVLSSVFACTKTKVFNENTQVITQEEYRALFGMDTVNLTTSNADKAKQKNSAQYTSILYADLFQKSIPSNELSDMSEILLSSGDKIMINELIIQNWMNETGVIVPTDQYMRDNPTDFIRETYIRFYLRKPTALESTWMTNMINDDQDLQWSWCIPLSLVLTNTYSIKQLI